MRKTKMGISPGLLGAALYIAALLGAIAGSAVSFLPVILLAGYVLLAEDNPWLRRTAVKAAAIALSFALLIAVIGFIPDILNVLNFLFSIFGGHVSVPALSVIVLNVDTIILIVEKVILIALAVKALTQGWLNLSFFDKLIGKHVE